MAPSSEVKPFRISPSIDIQPLFERAFANVNFTDPIFSESPLSTPPSSPILGSPELSPIDALTAAPGLTQQVDRSHSKAQSKEHRKRKRAEEKNDACAYEPPPDTKRRHIDPSVNHVQTVDLDLSLVRAAANGFTGYHSAEENQSREYTLDEMVGPDSLFGFELIPWDATFSLPIVNHKNTLLGVGVSNPRDPEWTNSTTRAADKMDRLRPKASFTPKQKQGSRRGRLYTLNAGVVNGQGLRAPANRKQANARSTAVVDELRADMDFRRIAGHGSGAFRAWQGAMYQSYADNKRSLLQYDSRLRWNYNNSIFAAAAYNFGPRVVSLDHADYENRPDGWCAITALSPSQGGYDYKKGGHLILWDLRLVIEFPPGATILIPSAILRHSNVAIGPNEHRMSFAQYTSGHLFRFVERGFRTEELFLASLTQKEKKEEKEKDENRWKVAIENFANMNDVWKQGPTK